MTGRRRHRFIRAHRVIAGLCALGLLGAAPAPAIAAGGIAPPVLPITERPEVTFVRVSPAAFRSSRCHRRHRRVVVTFDLNFDARVAGHILRLRGHPAPRRIRTFRFDALKGPNRHRVPAHGLRPGRYRLWLRARREFDTSGVRLPGDERKSRPKKTEFRVEGCCDPPILVKRPSSDAE